MEHTNQSTEHVQSPAAASQDAGAQTVTLDEPIRRGDQVIERLTIRKPTSGALRGVTLVALSQIDVIALQTVLPRICEPILTKQEIANLDPADLMAVGATVASFFMSKADRAAFQIA
ncbi:phage tail assembly protein [Bordetella sp. 2513F-2]